MMVTSVPLPPQRARTGEQQASGIRLDVQDAANACTMSGGFASLTKLDHVLWVQRRHEERQTFIDGSVGFAPVSESGNGTNRGLTSGSPPLVTSRSQWRDRAGVTPASAFRSRGNVFLIIFRVVRQSERNA